MTNLNDVLLAMSNIPVDDPIAEIWGRGLQGGRYTVIEYTGALPITINANGEPLIDYRIYGNTVQTGTPTPENPIIPVGVGERTENLLAANSTSVTVNTVTISNDNGKITVTGRASVEISSTNLAWKNAFTFRLKAGSYYFAGFASGGVSSYLRNANDDTRISMPNSSFVLSNDTDVYIGFWVYSKNDMTFNIMLNTGSTPLPYEPYGYKLPILSNATTTNIYLGEVETTRRIAKIDLGTLNWSKTQSGNFLSNTLINDMKVVSNIQKNNAFSDMFTEVASDSVARTPYSFSSCLDTLPKPFVNSTGFEDMTTEEFKEAMSGVYMYYVLATEETGTLNEPLRKIGNYADTVSMEQAGASIPTNKGGTVIDYDGALKPSQMYIKYLGR